MHWIETILIILPGSCLISFVQLLRYNSRDPWDVDTDQIHATFPTSELLALTSDTLLTVTFMTLKFGRYKFNWSSMASLLPEVYLVILLAARWILAYHVDDRFAALVQKHSGALYLIRFCCAVVAATFSAYMNPTIRSFVLGLLRVGLLGTLVLAIYVNKT